MHGRYYCILPLIVSVAGTCGCRVIEAYCLIIYDKLSIKLCTCKCQNYVCPHYFFWRREDNLEAIVLTRWCIIFNASSNRIWWLDMRRANILMFFDQCLLEFITDLMSFTITILPPGGKLGRYIPNLAGLLLALNKNNTTQRQINSLYMFVPIGYNPYRVSADCGLTPGARYAWLLALIKPRQSHHIQCWMISNRLKNPIHS